MKKFLTTFLMILITQVVFAGEYCKIGNTNIVLSDKADAMQKEAAGELQKHLKKLLSKPLKLNGRTPEKITFFVGLSPEAEKAGFTDIPAAGTLPGKFAIFRKNDNFLLYGMDSAQGRKSLYNGRSHCGTFFAVSYFVQKYLQVKFIMPGEKYIIYPSSAEVEFSAAADIPAPAYKLRHFGHGGKNANWRESVLWYRRRLGVLPEEYRADHAYFFINNWNRRFKNRPEFFALYNGRRFNGSYPYHFPCTSNPEVIKQIVDDIKAVVKKDPAVKNIRFFCDAPVYTCECSNCRNSPAGKFIEGEDHSETVYALIAQVGHELQKSYPDMGFSTQTKGISYHQPPRSIKLPANVYMSILTAHFNQPNYEEVRQKCLQWRNAGAIVLVKSYPRGPEMKDYPVMNPRRIAEYYRELAGFMDGSMIAEGRGNVPYTFSVLNNYVHSAVMFDPSVNVEELIREFCSFAAPGAGKELQAFYDRMEKLQASANFRDDPLLNYYIYFRLKEPRIFLNAALKKAPGNEFLQQLDKDFADFEKKSAACSAFITSEEQLKKIQQGFEARQQPIKLGAADTVINFRAFSFFRDFQTAQAKLEKSDTQLLLTIDCQENRMKELLVTCQENHQGQMWNDDEIELFICKPGATEPYLHFMVNAQGFYRIQRVSGGKAVELTGFELKTQSTLNKDSWRLQIALPLGELKEFISDGKTAMAIYRHRPPRQGDKNQFSGAQKPVNGAFRDISGRFEVEF